MIDEYIEFEAGQTVVITKGPFEGFGGTVVKDVDYRVCVDIDVLGTACALSIPRNDLRHHATLISREVKDVIAALEYLVDDHLETEAFILHKTPRWVERATRDWTDDELRALRDEHLAFEAAIDRDVANTRDAAFARLEREPTAEAAKWIAENEAAQFRPRSDLTPLRSAADLRHRTETLWRLDQVKGDPLDGTQPVARDAQLEAQIVAAPEAREPYIVYGDWLQAQGDPRGTLIALHAGGGRTERAARRHHDRHARYFLGGVDVDYDAVWIDWHLGFISSAKVHLKREHEEAGRDQAAVLGALLRLPSTQFLQALTIGCASVHETGVEEAILRTLIEAGARPTLRSLTWVTDQEEEMLSWTSTGNLEPLWSLYPNLRALEIQAGSLELGDIALLDLERLKIETCQLASANLQSLVRPWPKLDSFELWFGSVERDAMSPLDARVPQILEAAPNITRLGLVNTENTDELCKQLVTWPVWSRLEVLDISQGTLTDDGAAILAAALPRAPRLQRITVSDSYLTEAGIATLSACPDVRSTYQREPYAGETERYCAVAE